MLGFESNSVYLPYGINKVEPSLYFPHTNLPDLGKPSILCGVATMI
jgi:hypothetical protein